MSGWIGAILILLACGALGNMAALRLTRQRQRMLSVQQGLAALIKEIDYLRTPLAPALNSAAECAADAGELFRITAELLASGEGYTGEEAWMQALRQTQRLWTEEESAALGTVALGLGQQDADSQLRHLELGRIRLEGCEQQAAEQCSRYCKLWRSLGWMGGVVLVLLLI